MPRHSERAPSEAHEWVSFDDPDEERTWLFDVTFLTSSWTCIFGRGCQGVLTGPAPELVQGCCSYGAHFTGKKDARAVERAAAKLTPDIWQFHKQGRRGVVKKLADGDLGTRIVDDACIFLNRDGFAAGPGCALHLRAVRTGRHHADLKPEVCWQVPLRRLDEEQEDGTVVSTLTEFGRDGWGEGGHDFSWWCTEAPEAFTAREPVYRTLSVELRKMLGPKLHRQVTDYLDQRRRSRPAPVVHPAEVTLRTRRARRA